MCMPGCTYKHQNKRICCGCLLLRLVDGCWVCREDNAGKVCVRSFQFCLTESLPDFCRLVERAYCKSGGHCMKEGD